MRALLFALLMTTAAQADASRSWDGSSATLVAADDGSNGHLADVVFVNVLSQSLNRMTFVLTLGGLTVGVQVSHSRGYDPDTFTLTNLPEGVVALPAQISLDEFDTGTIQLFMLTDMVMG